MDAHGAPAPRAEAEVLPAAADGRVHVLVVEDDESLAGVLAETLERHAIAVDVAGSGETAWAAARRRRPDAVVLDIAIPDGDGYWLAERLRSDPRFREVPIVAYTALDLSEDERERLRRSGVEVLTKGRTDAAALERRILALLALLPA